MGEHSKIEWTHHTFNPWRGCTKVSPGCKHCYAETQAKRNPEVLGIWGDNGARVVASESMWRKPLAWDKAAAAAGERHRVFCASMADVFEDRPELIAPRSRLLKLIEDTPHLDWLLLTKRPEGVMDRLREIAEGPLDSPGVMVAHRWLNGEPPRNVWLGTSVEDQQRADERIPYLLSIPAVVRFLSCEPLLGHVNINGGLFTQPPDGVPDEPAETGGLWSGPRALGDAGIHWVIGGGESGPNARPMHPDWARSIRDQCANAGVSFFFKQWGEWCDADQLHEDEWVKIEAHPRNPFPNGYPKGSIRVGKKRAGRLLDERTHDEFPTVEVEA